MIRAALLLACLLAGCTTYSVEPFTDTATKQVICCRAVVTSSRDVGTLNFDAVLAQGNYRVRLAETGVSASAPIAAAAIGASAVTGAAIDAAGTIIKLAP